MVKLSHLGKKKKSNNCLAGGKESGIFEDSSSAQPRPRMNPPGGKTSDIFGSPVPTSVVRAHPNKPKVFVLLLLSNQEASSSVSCLAVLSQCNTSYSF